jgi:hypothetical protein
MRGAVSRSISSNTSGSPRVTRAADGTGITQAADAELPRTSKDINTSSPAPSQATSARSSVTAGPSCAGM